MLSAQSKQTSVKSRHLLPCSLSVLVVVDAMQIHIRKYPILRDYVVTRERTERRNYCYSNGTQRELTNSCQVTSLW